MFPKSSGIAIIFCILSCTTRTQVSESSQTADIDSSNAEVNVSAATFYDVTLLTDTSRLERVYKFPILVQQGRGGSAHEKINHTLQESELELIVGEQDSSIFEKIWPGEDSFSGITEFDYNVIENSPKVFSIEFIKEGCGAYCESYSTYYNFDANSGKLITLQDLFTEEGIKAIAKIIINERKSLIHETLEGADHSEDPEGMREMYSACLEYMTPESFELGKFYIESSMITFIGARCSSHAVRALDEIDEFVNGKSLEELSSHLTPYGKSLLSK